MALSGNSAQSTPTHTTGYVPPEISSTEANDSVDLSNSILHECFVNGSMLVPISYFPPVPPGGNGTVTNPPNETTPGMNSNESSYGLMESGVRVYW